MKRVLSNLLILIVIIFIVLLTTLLIPSQSPQRVLLGFDTELVDAPEDIAFVTSALEAHDARATFFVTGDFVQQRPELVAELAQSHEIACHTMTHPRLRAVNRTRLAWELSECTRVVEDLTGKPVRGFRAPYNLMTRAAYDELPKAGYSYDASWFEHLGLFAPKPNMPALRISSWGFVPLEDYFLIKLLPLGDLAFRVMTWNDDETVILDLHPRIVAEHPEAFTKLLDYYATRNATFETHESVFLSSSGG